MEALSTCCDSVMIGEAYDVNNQMVARCGFCFEMSEFKTIEQLSA
jgi:hypothetical protein